MERATGGKVGEGGARRWAGTCDDRRLRDVSQTEGQSPAHEPVEPGLDGRILRSSGWVALSLAGKQLASIFSLLVLARLLEPRAFGLVALAWTVLAFAEKIQESGVGSALIHRRHEIEQAAASALIWAPLASLILYAATFLVAPLMAHLLRAPGLVSVLRVLGLVLLLRGLMVVPAAILGRNLAYRARAKADVGSSLVQVAVSISLAFAGFGVWSLVIGALAAAVAQTLLLWAVVPWRPSPTAASRRVLIEMMRYGRFVSAGSILNVIDNTIDNIAIARMLGTTPLGYYAIAFRLADFPNSVIGYVVGRVMFPVYSILQGDLQAVRRAYLQNLQRIAIVALPVSVGIAVAAKPIVLSLFGEKWLLAVTPLRILAIYGLLKSFAAPAGELFKGIGRPHLNPLFSIPHLALAVPILYILIRSLRLDGAALGMLVLMAVTGLPAMFLAMRLVDVSIRDTAHALATPILCSALLGVALTILLWATQSFSPIISLMTLIGAGLLVFSSAAAAFARPVLMPMWASIRETRKLDSAADAPVEVAARDLPTTRRSAAAVHPEHQESVDFSDEK
jgi:O-antigen/teichoic acid export membrane protein